jgi:hypothetical protein
LDDLREYVAKKFNRGAYAGHAHSAEAAPFPP